MISVKKGIRSEEVKLQGQHTLFVEGKDKNAIDPKVLKHLLGASIRIEPLGPSYYVKSVAEALFCNHPHYYFLIDRDHNDDAYVNHCWGNFPDPKTHNLLIWKKKEIENYFLDPDYLFCSKYCEVGRDELGKKILEFANARLHLDAANFVITSIREELKSNWIKVFTNPDEFDTKEKALQKLQDAPEFNERKNHIEQKVSHAEIETQFELFWNKMTGGKEKLEFDTGDWPAMIQGKKVLSQLISSGHFRVPDAQGNPVQGSDKMKEIIKDLLKKDPDDLPEDFRELKRLIESRVSTGGPH